jgi:hypothetical protein
MLLNAQSFPFVIDLACLASRREYLKLEKWLTDKIREHGEPFISACVKFLQVICKICCVKVINLITCPSIQGKNETPVLVSYIVSNVTLWGRLLNFNSVSCIV